MLQTNNFKLHPSLTTILPCSVDENFGEVIWPLAYIKINGKI